MCEQIVNISEIYKHMQTILGTSFNSVAKTPVPTKSITINFTITKRFQVIHQAPAAKSVQIHACGRRWKTYLKNIICFWYQYPHHWFHLYLHCVHMCSVLLCVTHIGWHWHMFCISDIVSCKLTPGLHVKCKQRLSTPSPGLKPAPFAHMCKCVHICKV